MLAFKIDLTYLNEKFWFLGQRWKSYFSKKRE